jgi:trehalose 6-phosphate synthase
MQERPVVIASNRGPISFVEEDDRLVGRRGGGGMVSGLAPLVESGQATWIAAALSEADRAASPDGIAKVDGLQARLLHLDASDQRAYYDVVSNSTLWFLHHGLFDRTREPTYDSAWWEAWEAYRRVNQHFAEAVIEHAPQGAAVLVQDYHLTLLAPMVRSRRDDLRLVHFHHTPFTGPGGAGVLPPGPRGEMLDGLAAHHACGFHTPMWAGNYMATQELLAGREASPFHATLNSDLEELESVSSSKACDSALTALEELVGDRLLIARVDRMELSKNIVRGFAAWDLLLEREPTLRGAATFVACCYPSRLGVPAYARYRDEVLAEVDRVNERWSTGDWQPIVLLIDDDYPRSLAVLRRYDVLVVNPIRDGLNLVAKEGPMINQRQGQLVLSTEAGATWELGAAADGVNPFDLEHTAAAILEALGRDMGERTERSRLLRELACARTPADWLADQLAAAG